MRSTLVLVLVAVLLTYGAAFGQRRRGSDKAPKIGSKAPDFQLKVLNSKKKVKLSQFKGKKPVALIFGSYT